MKISNVADARHLCSAWAEVGAMLTYTACNREMGWPDIHWLARDLGWAGGSHRVSFGQELEYAVGA